MVTMYETRKMAIPEIYPEHDAYWKSANEGRLIIKKCADCKEYHHYPRLLCPFCHSDRTFWVDVNGTGKIYTYSVMRKGTPYAIAFVELDEGPRIMTNIVDCDLDDIHINQRVQLVFKQSGDKENRGAFVPCFSPIKEN